MNETQNNQESVNIESTNTPEEFQTSSEQSNINNNMPRRSRLSKSFQRKSRNTFIISTIAIILIIFTLFKFGLPLISDASFLFGRVTSTEKKNENLEKKVDFVAAPRLDGLPKAIKEKFLRISGSSISGLTIHIYLNGKKETETKADENGDFETKIELTDGENIIKAKAVKNTSESDFSESQIVSFKIKGPELSIDSPSEGANISGQLPIEVRGKSDPDTSVKVNDFQAIVNSLGEWSYFLTLKGGDNEIKVISTDSAGNTTEKIIHVNYSQ